MDNYITIREAIQAAVAIHHKASKLELLSGSLARAAEEYMDALAEQDAERVVELRERMLDLAQQLIDEGEEESDASDA